jgi:hypothetical protein
MLPRWLTDYPILVGAACWGCCILVSAMLVWRAKRRDDL